MEAAGIQALTGDRFEVRQRLGEGGFGTVYAAWDKELGINVALKQLRQQSPDAIYRFKKEFRLLAQVAHPNLVSLYELFHKPIGWYFTMELVPGRTMLEHLRPGRPAVGAWDATLRPHDPTQQRPHDAPPVLPRSAGAAPDADRVRRVFAQLAQALCALHEAGLLHRDVKPSNVLVTPDDRVVVLDFGLAVPMSARGEGEVVGTPMYMSPEQWIGTEITEASDWYAFGVVLYEALTGGTPFDGHGAEIARNMLAHPPTPPHEVDERVPLPLSALCMDLLAIEPGARPTGPEVLRRLGGDEAGERHTDRQQRAFVGRAAELAQLRHALDAVADGGPRVVEVVGESGLGKSALCEHFLASLGDETQALVLPGKSYEQESLPYKALDGVIDELSRVLLKRWRGNAVWPEHAADLARLFPVLGRVPGFQRAQAGSDGRSAVEVRRHAVQALRALLAGLGRERRVVLFLDDVQWGDVDSAVLLHHLLAPPDPPPLLLIMAYRGDEAEDSHFLRELRARAEAAGRAPATTRIQLTRLSAEDSEQLAQELLARRRPRPGVVAELAREAGGSPLLIEELARFARIDDAAAAPRTPDSFERRALFEHMVAERVRDLPESWQRFLAVVGLASRPLDLETARALAGMESLDRTQLNRLRSGHLLRTQKQDSGRDLVAPYHERLREIVARSLDQDERRRIHRALADAFARSAPGLVATHLSEAGELDRAADYALQAAAQAEAALAFDEAAELYARALEWRPQDRAPLAKHAAALANAGRCAQAAPRYLEAAEQASGLPKLKLELHAFEQFMIGGQNDEGLALLHRLCAATRLPRPRPGRRALTGMAIDVVRLRLRGYDFAERAAADIDALLLFKIDLCFSASRNLLLRDPMAGTRYSVRALRLALDAGEPTRIVEGLANVGAVLAVAGKQMGQVLLERARLVADRVGTPYALGLLRFWSSYVDHIEGRWTQSLAGWNETVLLLRQCRGVQGEIQKAELNAILATQVLGRFDELKAMTERLMADAQASGNVYSEVYGRLYSAIPPLAAGDPVEARARIHEATRRAPADDFFVQNTAIKLESFCDLYEGRPAGVLQRLEAAWDKFEKARMTSVARFIVVFEGLRGGATLAARLQGGAQPLAQAERSARVCARFDRPYAQAQAALLEAALATHRGDRPRALAELERATAAYEEAGMLLEAMCARRRRAEVARDRAALDAADAELRARGIADPARWTCANAPGFVTSYSGGEDAAQ